MRFDGSATLSPTCKAENDNDHDNNNGDSDDGEFQIEGAEDVKEEEVIPVRSCERSFASVCLGDGVSATPAHTSNETSSNEAINTNVDDAFRSSNNLSSNEIPKDTLKTAYAVVNTATAIDNLKICEMNKGEV